MSKQEVEELRSVVDSNIQDGAFLEAGASAPYRGLLERKRNVASRALRRKVPALPIHDPQRAVTWLDGRGDEAGSSPGGMFTWYALAALHRFHLERPTTPRAPGSAPHRIKPGRADLEFLALSLHLHHQGRLHRFYTNDTDLAAAAQQMRVPAQNTFADGKLRQTAASLAAYERDEWSPGKWIAREPEILCNLTGYLRPRPGNQSLYSFEVLCQFYALNDAEQRWQLHSRGIVLADLLDVLEVVRSSFWRGDEHVARAAREMALSPDLVSVIAGVLAPADYQVAASLVGLEVNQHLGMADAPSSPLAASDVLILAAAINRAAVAHLTGDRSTIRLHYSSNRISRIHQFLTGSELAFVRFVPGTGKKELSSVPALLQAVRGIKLEVGP